MFRIVYLLQCVKSKCVGKATVQCASPQLFKQVQQWNWTFAEN